MSACGFLLSFIGLQDKVLPQLCGGDWVELAASIGMFGALETILSVNSPAMLFVEWMVMMLAMMPLLVEQPLIHVRQSSRSSNRWLQMAAFVFGFILVWLLVAPAFILLALVVNLVLGVAAPFVVAGLAFVWSATPWHQKALNRGHRLSSLRVFGFAAVKDATRYGWLHAEWCVASCWAWMLVPLVWGKQHQWIMLAVAVVMFLYRAGPPKRPIWRSPFAPIDLPTATLKVFLRSRSKVVQSHE